MRGTYIIDDIKYGLLSLTMVVIIVNLSKVIPIFHLVHVGWHVIDVLRVVEIF